MSSNNNYFLEDSDNWGAATTSVTYDVGDKVANAEQHVWQFQTSAGRILAADITVDNATKVTVAFDVAPGSGTYRLVGVGP